MPASMPVKATWHSLPLTHPTHMSFKFGILLLFVLVACFFVACSAKRSREDYERRRQEMLERKRSMFAKQGKHPR